MRTRNCQNGHQIISRPFRVGRAALVSLVCVSWNVKRAREGSRRAVHRVCVFLLASVSRSHLIPHIRPIESDKGAVSWPRVPGVQKMGFGLAVCRLWRAVANGERVLKRPARKGVAGARTERVVIFWFQILSTLG